MSSWSGSGARIQSPGNNEDDSELLRHLPGSVWKAPTDHFSSLPRSSLPQGSCTPIIRLSSWGQEAPGGHEAHSGSEVGQVQSVAGYGSGSCFLAAASVAAATATPCFLIHYLLWPRSPCPQLCPREGRPKHSEWDRYPDGKTIRVSWLQSNLDFQALPFSPALYSKSEQWCGDPPLPASPTVVTYPSPFVIPSCQLGGGIGWARSVSIDSSGLVPLPLCSMGKQRSREAQNALSR